MAFFILEDETRHSADDKGGEDEEHIVCNQAEEECG